MTWQNFQDQAFRLTEQDVQDLAPAIMRQYQDAIKAINNDIKDVYADILSGVDPADYYNTMLKYDRLTKLLDGVTKQYSTFSRQAGVLVAETGKISMSNNFYRLQYTHKWLVPGLDFALLPNELLQLSVYGTLKSWKNYEASIFRKIFGPGKQYIPQHGTLADLLAANRLKEISNIQRAISQGLLRGQSYTKTAAAIKDVIGQFIKKDGVIHTKGAMANAQRIIRTESTRILNEASIANTEYARSEGIEIVRFWGASLDSRTRPVHGALDGKPENKDGYFESRAGKVKAPGQFADAGNNIQCRCTTWESVNGSKPTLRRGRNPETGENEVFDYKDFDQWAKDNGLKKNKFDQYYNQGDKPLKTPKKKPTGSKKRPDTFGISLEKMQKNKLPKDVKSAGIDSEKYKQWIWENWSQ